MTEREAPGGISGKGESDDLQNMAWTDDGDECGGL